MIKHKLGADQTERIQAVEVHPENRMMDLGPPKEIEVRLKRGFVDGKIYNCVQLLQGWTVFNFKGRGNKVSSGIWLWSPWLTSYTV